MSILVFFNISFNVKKLKLKKFKYLAKSYIFIIKFV